MGAAARKERISECWTERYLAIPFVDRGARFTGCDCHGLAELIFREELGVSLPAYEGIKPGDDPAKLREILRAAATPIWKEISAGEEREFDLVLMRGIVAAEGRRASRPIHIGMVVQPGRLIHIEQGTGVSVVDYRRHPSVKHRVISFHRYRPGA